MKKLVLIFCALCCLTLSSCKSATVRLIEENISDIGEVTLDSIDAIEEAERIVNLTQNTNPDQYKQIGNLDVLQEARATYDTLKAEYDSEQRISRARIAIDNIGDSITLNSAHFVETARERYNELTNDEKNLIENYPILENAEKVLGELKADNLTSRISSLGTVTLNDKSEIEKIRNAYDELTDAEKNMISNYDVLLSAEKELSSLKIKNAVDLINDIGTVTLDSSSDIRKAQNAWDELSADEKKQAAIDGDSILLKANDTLDSLQNSSYSSNNNNTQKPVQKKNPTMGDTNAMLSAISYINTNIGFSRQGLIEQLEYEGYSNSEATYGADNCGADWYAQAVIRASNYISTMPFSKQGLIEQLEYEGFTHDQAVYGVEEIGY